ncbi:hypothetical protein [Klenkia brasiliensis]|uniref:SipW-cognate class signal peptide n=1 Tax=Klenkia brasiliensis TaxID=333142 RepID=A0A1G7RC02_9ACTN|nr:hypothetical protein [Klenkia brasiliensis]SDG08263.1 hypothetical protein SAMN05660324_1843 [Klenkia brasiliensis]
MTTDPQHPDTPAHCARHGRRRRLAGAATLAVAGAALVGTGAFSSWGATASATGGLTAGSVSVGMVDANGGTFSTAVGNLLPADYFYRYVDVTNSGSAASTFTGTVTATGALAGSLQVDVTSCSVAWTTVSGASTCSGTQTVLASGTPTTGTPLTVAHGSIATGAGNAQHVRYKVTFASGASTSLQGATGSIAASVSNTVVGGTDRTGG